MTENTTVSNNPFPPKKKKKKWLKWVIIIIVLVAMGLIIWRNITANNQRSASQNQNLPLFSAQNSDLSEKISLSGNVKTVFLTEVNTKAEGVVKTVYVQNGQEVKQGDKLFEIELSPESKQKSQSAYNSYLSAQNNLESAKAQLYSAQSTLFNKNQYFLNHAVEEDLETNDPTYIQQQADWLNAEASYINQENKIKTSQQAVTVSYLDYQQYQSTVVAPTSGQVEGIAVTEGMMISNTDETSQRLAVIKTGETLLIQLNVSEMDIGKVKVGQKADITLAATGDEVYEGEVISIDQIGSVSNSSATYPVLVGFTAPEGVTILPNMSADVDLRVSDQKDVLTVSTLAVQKDEQGNYYVNLVTAQHGSGPNQSVTTEKRIVTIGTQTENLTEIKSGLQVGDQVQMNDFNAVFSNSNSNNMMMMGGPMVGVSGSAPAGGGNRGGGSNNGNGGNR